MSNEELQARLCVLETFVLSGLAIAMINAGPDPGKKRSIATLDTIKAASRLRLAETSSNVKLGESYLDELLSDLSQNLDRILPKGGQA
jgi:hypothetical protein